MQQKHVIPAIFAFAAIILLATQCLYIVDQRQHAILLQLGQPIGELKGPGLHAKLPFIQNVRYFDRRILPVDPGPEQVVISSASVVPAGPAQNQSEKGEPQGDAPSIRNVTGEPIILDTFARYKITDALQFMKTLRTIEYANSRLESILKDSTKAELGKTTLQQLLSPERSSVTRDILKRVNANIQREKLGIEIVDVRIVRADLTAELRTSTVRRMVSELKERATETRARGEERALQIRSTAEKERTVILAEAQRDAQIIRGQGDKDAIKIYTEAFNKDKNFFAFTRTLEAYKNALSDPDTQLILSPDSKFLKLFHAPQGGAE